MEEHGNVDSEDSFQKDNYIDHKMTSMTPLKNNINYDISTFRKILDDYDYLKEENVKLRTLLEKEKSKAQKLEEKMLAHQSKIAASNKELEMLKE